MGSLAVPASALARALALAAVTLAAAPGCATVFAGDRVNVPVSSQTPGAQVLVDGVPVGKTPIVLGLPASQAHVIEIVGPQHRGVCRFEPSIGVVWIALDIITGVWPLAVDAITGDWSSVDDTACFGPV